MTPHLWRVALGIFEFFLSRGSHQNHVKMYFEEKMFFTHVFSKEKYKFRSREQFT
jgi:hypothetical protein